MLLQKNDKVFLKSKNSFQKLNLYYSDSYSHCYGLEGVIIYIFSDGATEVYFEDLNETFASPQEGLIKVTPENRDFLVLIKPWNEILKLYPTTPKSCAVYANEIGIYKPIAGTIYFDYLPETFWAEDSYTFLCKKETSEIKYKKGDKITLHSKDYFRENDEKFFVLPMGIVNKYCSTTVTIKEIYPSLNWFIPEETENWCWPLYMIDENPISLYDIYKDYFFKSKEIKENEYLFNGPPKYQIYKGPKIGEILKRNTYNLTKKYVPPEEEEISNGNIIYADPILLDIDDEI